jgi:hypothetical protein
MLEFKNTRIQKSTKYENIKLQKKENTKTKKNQDIKIQR